MDKIQLAKKFISQDIYKKHSLFENKIIDYLWITSTYNLSILGKLPCIALYILCGYYFLI